MQERFYLVSGAANDGRKDGAGSVVAGEARLHQAGAIVAHQGGGLLVVAHGVTSENSRVGMLVLVSGVKLAV